MNRGSCSPGFGEGIPLISPNETDDDEVFPNMLGTKKAALPPQVADFSSYQSNGGDVVSGGARTSRNLDRMASGASSMYGSDELVHLLPESNSRKGHDLLSFLPIRQSPLVTDMDEGVPGDTKGKRVESPFSPSTRSTGSHDKSSFLATYDKTDAKADITIIHKPLATIDSKRQLLLRASSEFNERAHGPSFQRPHSELTDTHRPVLSTFSVDPSVNYKKQNKRPNSDIGGASDKGDLVLTGSSSCGSPLLVVSLNFLHEHDISSPSSPKY